MRTTTEIKVDDFYVQCAARELLDYGIDPNDAAAVVDYLMNCDPYLGHMLPGTVTREIAGPFIAAVTAAAHTRPFAEDKPDFEEEWGELFRKGG